jgi:hypothetical protein
MWIRSGSGKEEVRKFGDWCMRHSERLHPRADSSKTIQNATESREESIKHSFNSCMRAFGWNLGRDNWSPAIEPVSYWRDGMTIEMLAGDFDQCGDTVQEEIRGCEDRALTEIDRDRCPATETEVRKVLQNGISRCMASRGYSRAYFTWGLFELCEKTWFDRVGTLESALYSDPGHTPAAQVRQARDNWVATKAVVRREWISSYQAGLLPSGCWPY